MIDALVLLGLAAVALADMFLVPSGVPFCFLYICAMSFLADSVRLRPHVLKIGLACAVLTIIAAAAKWEPSRADNVIQNRFLAIAALGAATHSTRRLVRVEDRQAESEAELQRLGG